VAKVCSSARITNLLRFDVTIWGAESVPTRSDFASLAAHLSYNEPTISSLLGHRTHRGTSRYVHSADTVLVAAADAVAHATMNLMASDQAQPQLRDRRRDGSVVWDEFTVL
jgi:hypothetical protein